ncbi:MAG: hypothetical protein Q4C10_14885 [Clostridia bacterium]|nr:hypothetical protein [Clostridia bacterium]
MIVYLVAALQALYYAARVPLILALCLRTGGEPSFGFALGAFRRRGALRRAQRSPCSPKKKRRGGGSYGLRLIRRLRPGRLSLEGTLCLGDAAATALACGAICAAAELFPADRPARVRVAPDFDGSAPRCALSLTATLPLGRLLLTLLRAGARAG